jgi:hypothetical protein
MTWVYDRFTAVPYLRFLGEPQTGKTRLLQLCSAISYKGIAASGNITGAALFRTIDLVRGTVAIDEADFKNSDESADLTKILNNGYAADMPVIRCNRNDFSPEAFRVYGPKIISTRQRFQDDATESRCLTFETRIRKVPEHIPLQLPASFEQQACTLRNKLLQWRFDQFRETKAQEGKMRDLSPRLGQIGASLAAVAPNEDWLDKLVQFLRQADGDREDSPKGLVKRAIELMQGDPPRATYTVGNITDQVNALAKQVGVEQMTAKKVGAILTALGYRKRRTASGYEVDLDTEPTSMEAGKS